MKKIRLRKVAVVALAGLSGGLLLYTSQSVQQAEGELRRQQSALAAQEEAIQVLRAEWAYLNSPARLEELAAEYLDMQAPAAGQLLPGGAPILPEQSTHGEGLMQPVAHEPAEKAP